VTRIYGLYCIPTIHNMAPSAISPEETPQIPSGDSTVLALRKTLTSENEALAARFRALFSLKYLACQEPRTENSVPAIDAIAAGFASPSALLKHELAYCLGQSRHDAAVPYLQKVLSDREEDPMCRHEAAEAIGALGDKGSLKLLIERRDDENEETVVKETCQIAVGRIEWEHSDAGKLEKLKQRYRLHRSAE
jgi:deoxyhypusine monooxygenase